jgi:cytochrome c oxidase subunit 3
MALRAFKQRAMQQYRLLMGITLVLGLAFVALQWSGFQWMWASGVRFSGAGAGQFLYIIAGLHALHVLGGIIALIIMFVKGFVGQRKNYSPVPVEVMATYWHFVDALWLYLVVFLIWLG